MAPADVHVVAVGRGEEIFAAAEQLAQELEASGLDVIYDDRPKVSPGVKFGDAELIGVPTILAVGKGLVDGVVEIKDRRSGEAENVAVDKAVDFVVNAVRNS
ncbi:Proline--tRNA ligase [compost metagenome]